MNRFLPVLLAATAALGLVVHAAEPPRLPSMEERNRMLREFRERESTLMQLPEYREARKEEIKLALARQLPDLERVLGLDPAQYDQLLALLAERQLRPPASGRFDPARDDPQEFNRRFLEQQQSEDAEIAAVIGARGLRQWKEYDATLSVRRQIQETGAVLAAAGVPLRQSQVESMLSVMTKRHEALIERQRREIEKEYENDMPRRPGRKAGVVVGDDPAADYRRWRERTLRHADEAERALHEAMASVLDAEQLRVSEQDGENRSKRQEARLRAQQALAEADEELTVVPPPGMIEVRPR
jgi:hypothetical protein